MVLYSENTRDSVTMEKKSVLDSHREVKTENNRMEIDGEENSNPNNAPSQRITNFSIEEILKPEFGSRRQALDIVSHFSAFTPVRSQNKPFHKRLSTSSSSSLTSSGSCSSSPSSPELPSPQGKSPDAEGRPQLWPAWVYCTRYSDRPSSGPRSRKIRKSKEKTPDEKRPRTAFTNDQLQRLKREFEECRYLTEQRRTDLAQELSLTEAQIKIWFQNKRAKIKKSVGAKHTLALSLMAQGLYNHATVTVKEEDGEEEEKIEGNS